MPRLIDRVSRFAMHRPSGLAVSRASRFALDLFFPPRCALCGRGDAWLCDACAALLPPADGHRCDICWTPVAGSTICGHCADTPPAFVSLRAACIFESGARALTHMLKYDGLTALAQPMAARMTRLVPAAVDVLVPVPLHGSRRRSRGYNQSEELARPIGAALAMPVEPRLLRRVRPTEPLAHVMSRDERRAIVAGAFAADERAAERRILLIDDVATTGATLDACAAALLAAGARDVRCLSWARAD